MFIYSYSTGGAIVCSLCDEPSAAEYVTDICTFTANTKVATCTSSPTANSIAVAACDQGTSSKVGTNATFKCKSGTYGINCLTCTEPLLASQYVNATCTITSDTAVLPCLVAKEGEYIVTSCSKGNSTTTGSNAVVASCPAGSACSGGVKTACQSS